MANLQIPGLFHAAIKRSPYAHAKINSIKLEPASQADGVVAVYTGQEMAADGVGSLPCGFNPPDIKVAPHMPLAIDKVRHVGDGVAVSAGAPRRASCRPCSR